MTHIAIISSSVRTGRKSHRVALYFKNYLETHGLASAGILDLNEYKFPLFEERLHLQQCWIFQQRSLPLTGSLS